MAGPSLQPNLHSLVSKDGASSAKIRHNRIISKVTCDDDVIFFNYQSYPLRPLTKIKWNN